MKSLRIALAQAEFTPGDMEYNGEKAQHLIQDAADQKADLILLPELWASGYDLKNCSQYGTGKGDGWFKWMGDQALKNSLAVGASLIEEQDKNFYNTFVLYDKQGSTLGAYRKIHLFQLLEEDKYLRAGKKLVTTKMGSIRTGLTICYDLRFPELYRAYAADRVELILVVAEWPERRIEHWKLLLQARAIENQCFIAAVNKTGFSQGEMLGGCSTIVDPMGEIIVQAGKAEELLIAEINTSEVNKIRRWMPVLKDRQPQIYFDFERQIGD